MSSTLRSCGEVSIYMTLLLRGLCVVCTFEKQKRRAALELEVLQDCFLDRSSEAAHLLNCCSFECITGVCVWTKGQHLDHSGAVFGALVCWTSPAADGAAFNGMAEKALELGLEPWPEWLDGHSRVPLAGGKF